MAFGFARTGDATIESHSSSRDSHRSWFRIGLVVVLGLVLSVFAFYIARILEEQRIGRELEIAAVDRVAAVQRELDSQFALQQALAAFHQSSAAVDLIGFRTFVRPLLRADSPLQAIGWAPLVTAGQRNAAERAARVEGLSAFTVTERDADGSLVPAAQRPAYTPVLYIEPPAGNEAATGFDLSSEPLRRRALETARDTGELSTTPRLSLVQDLESRSGFLSARAVYRPGAALDSVSSRRAALTGFVSAVFWVDDLIEGGLADLQPGGIDMYFFDPADGPQLDPLYVHASRTRGDDEPVAGRGHAVDGLVRHQGHIDVGGRQWSVLSLPAPGFLAARRGPLPWVLLLVGLVATIAVLAAQAASERRNRQLHESNVDLENSEARVRRVVESMPAVLVAFDDNGLVCAWNAEGERVTGYSAAEVMGRPATFLFEGSVSGPESRPAGDDYRDLEFALTAKDGTQHEVAWTRLSGSIPIPGWSSWQIGIDVTARNRVARETYDMQEQSLQRQKLESLGLLAGGIAHDFNNLLTAILGNASIAHDTISPSDPARAALDGVMQASQRAAMLTQQLLAYTGKGTFRTEPIDLSEHVREIGSLLRAAIPKKVRLRFELGADLPAVEADPAQLQQLVMNLVINGAEASGDEPGTVHVRTGTQQVDEHYVRSSSTGAEIGPGLYLYLEVQDDGQGMDAETQARIFDPFYSTKFTGRGLGLAAAMGIVRSHGGTMSVYSAPGRGSVFRVLLPASATAAPDQPRQSPLNPQGSGLILVVDDEAMIRELAHATLTDLGYDVVTAADGLKAVEIFGERGGEIACVLLDMTMPNLDGEETFKILHAQRPDLPMILSSGYNEIAATRRFTGRGIAGFLQKPYTAMDLGAKVREVLLAQSAQPR